MRRFTSDVAKGIFPHFDGAPTKLKKKIFSFHRALSNVYEIEIYSRVRSRCGKIFHVLLFSPLALSECENDDSQENLFNESYVMWHQ